MNFLLLLFSLSFLRAIVHPLGSWTWHTLTHSQLWCPSPPRLKIRLCPGSGQSLCPVNRLQDLLWANRLWSQRRSDAGPGSCIKTRLFPVSHSQVSTLRAQLHLHHCYHSPSSSLTTGCQLKETSRQAHCKPDNFIHHRPDRRGFFTSRFEKFPPNPLLSLLRGSALCHRPAKSFFLLSSEV